MLPLKTRKKMTMERVGAENGYMIAGEETRDLKKGELLFDTSAFCTMPLNPHGEAWVRL